MRVNLMVMLLMAGAARAEVPQVTTDIAPVHSLTAQVMGDLGTPSLLLPPQDDPHYFQMRPSQARMLAQSDVIVWMGTAMTPWLPRVIDTLGSDVTSLDLLDLPALPMLVEGDMATLHFPGDPTEDRDEPGAEQAPDDTHTHSHGNTDPHAWLDPMNAQAFLAAIAETLATADPDNAATYRVNAKAAQVRIAAMADELTSELTHARRITLVPYHDAYRYFFIRFDLQINGGLANTEATPPSAARLSEIRELLANAHRYCLFSEPGANLDLIAAVAPEASRPIPALDPLGADLTPGAALYETLMRRLANTIATCDTP